MPRGGRKPIYFGCIAEGCDREHSAKGYCDKHYKRFKKHGTHELVRIRVSKVCTVHDCGMPYFSMGYCKKHYYHKRDHGVVPYVRSARRLCGVDGCKDVHYGRNLCLSHYNKWKYSRPKSLAKYVSPYKSKQSFIGNPKCSVPGCHKLARSKTQDSVCTSHYNRKLRTGEYGGIILNPYGRSRICDVLDCGRPHHAKGYCAFHYSRYKYGNPVEYEAYCLPAKVKICKAKGCDGKVYGYGFCRTHYRKRRKPAEKDMCQIEGCKDWKHSGRYCMHHYRMYELGKRDNEKEA